VPALLRQQHFDGAHFRRRGQWPMMPWVSRLRTQLALSYAFGRALSAGQLIHPKKQVSRSWWNSFAVRLAAVPVRLPSGGVLRSHPAAAHSPDAVVHGLAGVPMAIGSSPLLALRGPPLSHSSTIR
jgi:hypothetical protein